MKIVFLIKSLLTRSRVIAVSNNRGWFYHKELHRWLIRAPNMEPLVKTNTYERGTYHSFEPSSFEIVRKVSFCEYTISAMFFNSCAEVYCCVFFPDKIVLLLAANVQYPCRIILSFIMKCWKKDLI